MNQNKKKAFGEIFKKYKEEMEIGYVPECFSKEVLNKCGVAGLFEVKNLFGERDFLGLIPKVKRFIDSNYILDDWNNLYDKNGTTLVSFNEDNLIERFEIPNRVTTIGDEAFKENGNIIEVIIPDSVMRIGNRAFYGCKNLQKVRMGKGLGQKGSLSGSFIFYDCPKLTEIYVDNIEYIRNFKHDNHPFTTSFDLYVGNVMFDKDVTIHKEFKEDVELDWILFCKSVRNVYSDSDKVRCQNGFIMNYEELFIMMHFPPLCVENIETVEQLKEFGREHHLDISDEACFRCLHFARKYR